MKTAPVGIHAPLKWEVGAVVPAENLMRIVLEELNSRAQGWLKGFTPKWFESIRGIGDGLHAHYGAAQAARCQSCPLSSTSWRKETTFIDYADIGC